MKILFFVHDLSCSRSNVKLVFLKPQDQDYEHECKSEQRIVTAMPQSSTTTLVDG